MWLRCALDDFTTYPIFQSVYDVCQWDSLGMTTDYPTGKAPSPENPLLLPAFVHYLLGTPFEFLVSLYVK